MNSHALALCCCLVILPAAGAAGANGPYFTQVAGPPGVAKYGSGNSAVWLDYDKDGDLDLHFINDPGSGGFYRNRLIEDGAPAAFQAVSVGLSGNGSYLTTVDFDKDGYMDVLNGHNRQPILYRNNRAGGFVDVTAGSGINVGNSQGPVWGDYDNDGYPDLYFAAHARVLYHNNRDGTFSDATALLSGVPAVAAAGAWLDYDTDGYDDLLLAPASGNLVLYRYDSVAGSFTDVTADAGLNLPSSPNRLAVGDYDKNTYPDVYVFRGGSNNYLLRNRGDGTFEEVAGAAGVDVTPGFGNNGGVTLTDFDLDGDLDLYANGGRYGSNSFFRNNDDGTFADETAASGLSNTDDSHHTAIGDFNNDGYPDIYEVNFTGYHSSKDKLLQSNLPEPAALALLALTGPALLRRRRRAGSARRRNTPRPRRAEPALQGARP